MIRLENELKQVTQQVNEAEELKQLAEEKRNEAASNISKEKESTFDKEKEFNDLTKQFELEKEKEIVLQSDKLVDEEKKKIWFTLWCLKLVFKLVGPRWSSA